MHRSTLRLAAVGAVLGALAVAAPAGAKTLHGTVVHKNKSDRSFVVAGPSGNLTVVSARTSPAVSRVVAMKVRRSRGANVASRIRSHGKAKRARLRGTVTYSRSHLFAISSRGTSILVHDNATPPSVGSNVTTTVSFGNNGDLEADDVNENGTNTGAVKIEGVINAIDPTARTLTVLADDNQEDTPAPTTTPAAPPTVTVHVPASFDITLFHVGDEVELIVVAQPDGSFLLQSVDEDDNGGNNQGQNGDEGDTNGQHNDGQNSGPAGGDGGGDQGGGGNGGD